MTDLLAISTLAREVFATSGDFVGLPIVETNVPGRMVATTDGGELVLRRPLYSVVAFRHQDFLAGLSAADVIAKVQECIADHAKQLQDICSTGVIAFGLGPQLVQDPAGAVWWLDREQDVLTLQIASYLVFVRPTDTVGGNYQETRARAIQATLGGPKQVIQVPIVVPTNEGGSSCG